MSVPCALVAVCAPFEGFAGKGLFAPEGRVVGGDMEERTTRDGVAAASGLFPKNDFMKSNILVR